MVLYIFTGACFKKEHIDKYLNVFLWFVVLNLGYMASQLSGWDFIFKMRMSTIQNGWEAPIESNDPCGFMAFRSAAGMLMAMAIPVIMTRPWKLALPLGILMLFPIALSSASIAVIAGIFAILFCMYQKRYFVRKWNNIIIASLALALLVGGAGYATKKDDALKSFGDRACQWKLVLRDSMVHPIAGWGMDSFRNTTKEKKWQYAQHYEVLTGKKGFSVDYWDNPHNLFVSLAFEWGWIGVFLVIGYFVDLTRRFRLSYSSSNTTALYGVLMVTLILSISHFPVFLARFMCFIIPMAAMLEITMRTEDGI
jgi:small basic protein